MKTVLVDGLVLNGSQSGYRRIISNLLQRIACSDENRYNYIFVFQESGFRSLGQVRETPSCSFIVLPSFRSKWIRGISGQVLVPLIALLRRVDLIFQPATFGLGLPVRPTLTFVHTTTSFMMSAELRGRSALQQKMHNLLVRMTAYTSRELVFTTKQTMAEFLGFTGRSSERASVLGNGVLLRSYPESEGGLSHRLSRSQYILSVSQLYRLKNFDTLIRAFRMLKREQPKWKDLRLIIVGTVQELDYYAELKALAAEGDDVELLHDLSDAEMDFLYRHARLYCQMSHFEGYSLTPAEALLSGVPALISDIPAHREVYDNLVRYADPRRDTEVCSELSLSLAEEGSLSKERIQAVAKRYGFDSFFRRLEQAFDRTLSK